MKGSMIQTGTAQCAGKISEPESTEMTSPAKTSWQPRQRIRLFAAEVDYPSLPVTADASSGDRSVHDGKLTKQTSSMDHNGASA